MHYLGYELPRIPLPRTSVNSLDRNSSPIHPCRYNQASLGVLGNGLIELKGSDVGAQAVRGRFGKKTQ